MSNGKFTATEKRIVEVLLDGEPHTREELLSCLWDTEASLSNLHNHISHIRSKIPTGYRIVCELYKGKPHYTYFRKLNTEE